MTKNIDIPAKFRAAFLRKCPDGKWACLIERRITFLPYPVKTHLTLEETYMLICEEAIRDKPEAVRIANIFLGE